MRAPLLAALTLALAAASLPAADASAPPSAVCVPPGTLNQVCAGKMGGDLCVWFSGPSPISPVCLGLAVGQVDPVCVPPGSLNGACVGTLDGAVCAWIWGGPAHHYACAYRDGTVKACSNTLFATLYGSGYHCLGEPLP